MIAPGFRLEGDGLRSDIARDSCMWSAFFAAPFRWPEARQHLL